MSLFSRITGAVASFFQFGGPSGPGLNDNAGLLEAKDPTNTTFVIVRGATPVNSNDLVTKNYADTSPVAPKFAQRRVAYWAGGFATNTPAGFVNCSMQFAGGATGGGFNAATPLGATSREICQSALATATFGANEGSGPNYPPMTRGSGAGAGGFTQTSIFSIEAGFASSSVLFFAGLVANAGVGFSSVDFTTQTTLGAFVCGTKQTLAGGTYAGNFEIYNNTAGSVATATNTGIPIVIGHMYELVISCTPNSPSMTWALTDLTTSLTNTGNVSANLPSNAVGLYWQCGMQVTANGGANNTIGIIAYVLDAP